MFMSIPTTRSGRRASIVGLTLIALAGLSACGSDDAPSGTDSSTTAGVGPSSTPAPPTTDADSTPGSTAPDDSSPGSPPPDDTAVDSTLGPTAQGLVAIALQDLQERFDLTSADVTVVTVEEVTWRDASLGCPQKDMQYQQVLTPGTRIVLTDGDRTFNYHAGAGRDPFYCARPETPAPG